MTSHVLIVEDERDLQRVIAYNLKQAGFDVVSAHDGETALRAVREERFDLVILDLMLPDLPGTEICRRLKQNKETATIPVIMVTAKGEEIDRIVGFELGADDYVVKPFSVRELILRVRAVLRRAEGPTEPTERVDFGVLRIDRAAHRAWVAGHEVALTALELRLLLLLVDRRGRVLTRDLLLDEVWGSHVDVTSRNVDTHVKRVREKLGAAGEYIETVRGVGYRFAAEPPQDGAPRGASDA
jgi:two-component system phosphate regulon response regulator PhoB